MKVTVIKTFRDKETGEAHRKGQVIEITKKRYNEILKVGKFVTPYTEKTAEANAEENEEEAE